jgi:heme/copper-type cytochrome/quinol oxidase subunit 1
MTQYQPGPAAQPASPPGKTLGIVGLILAIFCSIIGAIVSFIAYRQSQAAGWKNNIALAGIVVGVVLFVLGIVINLTTGVYSNLMTR